MFFSVETLPFHQQNGRYDLEFRIQNTIRYDVIY